MSRNIPGIVLGNDPEDASSDSDYEPPFLQPVTKEELRLARSIKRSQRKAEKHAKAEVFKRMGDELYNKDKFDEAYIPYLEATQIWPSNVDYYVRLSMTYAKLGWYEEAAHASTRALTLDPKSIEARYLRGLARLEQRMLTAAKTDLEIVTKHDATHTKAAEALKAVMKALDAGTKLGTHTASSAPTAPETISVPELDFSYPQYDDTALEVDTLSNTSDSNHRGNGVPCRFYNREGCAKAALCPFSHAPDEKSVRDELGRNVCIYFLLDSCKFGNGKCVYSHTRYYLPKQGWWTSAAQTAKVKAILELSERTVKERRSLAQQLQLLERRSRKAPPRTAKTSRTPKVLSDPASWRAVAVDPTIEGAVESKVGKDGPATDIDSGEKKALSNVEETESARAGLEEGAQTSDTTPPPPADAADTDEGLTTEYELHGEDERVETTPDVVLPY